jgi:hypothetical protein
MLIRFISNTLCHCYVANDIVMAGNSTKTRDLTKKKILDHTIIPRHSYAGNKNIRNYVTARSENRSAGCN